MSLSYSKLSTSLLSVASPFVEVTVRGGTGDSLMTVAQYVSSPFMGVKTLSLNGVAHVHSGPLIQLKTKTIFK